MYLKRLELLGFKSFADRTDLALNSGISAIVGPNGCGKSNLSEAIRWVLGESNARDLRGTRMEDVIFAGSEQRRPLGFAQAAVTFDNTDAALRFPHPEITVTRRVDRAGASEFFINQTPCRLRDIHELFLDTGVGKDNYSFIGQGRIDQVLSSRPEERRGLMEEAAGVARYRLRKKEATNKLSDTEQSLLRLADLISALQDQLATLQEQSERAEAFRKLDEQWRKLETNLLHTGFRLLVGQREAVTNRLRGLQERLRQVGLDLADGDGALEAKRQVAGGLESEWDILQAGLVEAAADTERAGGRLALAREQVGRLAAERRRLEEDTGSLARRQASLEAERESILSLQAEAGRLQSSLLEELTRSEELWRQGQNRVQEQQAVVEALRQRSFTAAQTAADERNAAAAAVRGREQTEQRLRRLGQEKAQVAAELTATRQRQEAAEAQVQDRQQHLEAAMAAATRQQAAEATAGGRVQETGQAVARTKERLTGLNSRLSVLQDLKAEFEGYQKGPRTVLQARDRSLAWAKGVHGAVAELVRTTAEYERAIEVALGGTVQHIVTADEQAARDCIQELKARGAGRATFLPLDVVRGQDFSPTERAQFRSQRGVVGCALDLVEFSTTLRPAVSQLLGRVLVCRDLDAAMNVGRISGFRYRIVTVEGEIVAPGGAITGGSWSGRGTGLISREREREELQQAVAAATAELAAQRETAAAAARNQEAAILARRQAQDQAAAAQVALAEARGAVLRIAGEVERWSKDLATLDEEVRGLAAESVASGADERRHLAAAADLVIQQETLAAELADARHVLTAAEADVTRLGEGVTTLRIRLAEFGQEERSRSAQAQRLAADVAEAAAAVAERQRLLADLTRAEAMAAAALSDAQAEAAAAEAERQRRTAASVELQARRAKALEEAQGLERQIRSLRRTESELAGELRMAEVEAARLTGEHLALAERCRDKLGMEPEALAGQVLDPGELETAQTVVLDLRTQMEDLGPVYLGAPADYQAAQERWQFLANQQADLEEAKASLYRAIEELDRRIQTQFLAGFEEVRRSFQQVFRELFEGGRADLVLLDPANVLDSGVELLVQPPGKKMTPLNSLSGGERALCALALLFALLRVRPSPFVILDEVDAALDEANLKRFSDYLRRMSARVQFICITHQRVTMAAADCMYGVTMEEAGSSRLVSVRFADLVDKAS